MKPILFNTEMVRAILDGCKTVTRRVVKPNCRDNEIGFNVITNDLTGEYVCIEYFDEWENGTRYMPEPYHPGDILYVRETFFEHRGHFYYQADGKHEALAKLRITFKWHPSIYMPREAARIFLRVTDVRVERLRDMPHDGPLKEGIRWRDCPDGFTWKGDSEISCCYTTPMSAMKALWDSTIKPTDRDLYGWEANPWVWVIEFERTSKEQSDVSADS